MAWKGQEQEAREQQQVTVRSGEVCGMIDSRKFDFEGLQLRNAERRMLLHCREERLQMQSQGHGGNGPDYMQTNLIGEQLTSDP